MIYVDQEAIVLMYFICQCILTVMNADIFV